MAQSFPAIKEAKRCRLAFHAPAGFRFYLGFPLTTGDGYNVGTLNVIDVEHRDPAAREVYTLKDLAADRGQTSSSSISPRAA